MTTAGVGRPARWARQADPAPGRSTGYSLPGLRLARLYTRSRRVLSCLLVLAGFGQHPRI